MVLEVTINKSNIPQTTAPNAAFKLHGANMAMGQNTYDRFVRRHESFSGKGDQSSANNSNGSKKDPFLEYPARALAYTNEVGVALQPAIGATAAHAFWVPALLYFGADIWDKYKRGQDDTYQNSDKRTGIRQAVFHAAASLAGPTIAIHLAQQKGMDWGGKNWVEKTFDNLQKPGSKTASFIKGIPFFGEGLFKKLTDTTSKNTPLPSAKESVKKAFKAVNEGGWGLNTVGKSSLSKVFKTAVGFATLAIVVIPLDMFTERILIKKVVNPALNLRDRHDHDYFAKKDNKA